MYEKEKSYVTATLKYIDEELDIDIDEFNFSELPPEWVLLMKKEAQDHNLIRKDTDKHSFMEIMMRKKDGKL